MLRFLKFLPCALTLLAFPAGAQIPGFDLDGSGGGAGGIEEAEGPAKSVPLLVSEVTAIAPGKPFTVALQLKHPAEWHSYYVNSGGIEESLKLDWKLPEGFTAGPIQWPVPHVGEGYGGVKSFSYENPVFLVELTPPTTLETGKPVTLPVSASWQICHPLKGCVPEVFELALKLPVAEIPAVDADKEPLFRKARAALPVMSKAWTYSAEKAGDLFRIRLKPGQGAPAALDASGLEFISAVPWANSLSSGGKLTRDGETWLIELKPVTEKFNGEKVEPGTSLSGILLAKTPLDTTTGATAIVMPGTELSIDPPPAEPAAGQGTPVKGLEFGALMALLWSMAFGGLILNLMPCVFPVIGLKIMGFVQQSGQNHRKVVLHGVLFSLGVLVSFWALSGALFAARAAALAKTGSADSIGWGYQLQNPWVVLTLLVFIFVLALNMFGLFEIGTSATSIGGSLQAKQGAAGAFFSGVLATVVATPCSAPFLGVALGTAIGLPAGQFFAAFTAMAVGMALPYLLLSVFPKLVDYLPRPGAWMESFKQGMSFLLFATAGYLFWIYAKQVKEDNLLGPLFGLTLIGIAAWVYGRWNLPHRKSRTRGIAVMLALCFSVGGFLLATPPAPVQPNDDKLVWEEWSAAKVEELNAKGIPVYVDFTAAWCATCQLNKKVAYPAEVARLMKDRKVVVLKADKTSPHPEIDKKLSELKRTAIPVNVLYVPGKAPVITPELLTAAYMKDLITNNVPAAGK